MCAVSYQGGVYYYVPPAPAALSVELEGSAEKPTQRQPKDLRPECQGKKRSPVALTTPMSSSTGAYGW